MNILLTGVAGFIGYHLTQKLTSEGHNVLGIDNLNAYYDLNLKLSRLRELGIDVNKIVEDRVIESKNLNLVFIKTDLRNFEKVERLFSVMKIDKVVHLAAQAGVRYSLKNPKTYIDNNITGFYNLIENVVRLNIEHFIFASSSSVYGNAKQLPFTEDMCTNAPVSVYAATKIADEILARAYSQLHNTKITGVRLFTVYGEWGRPDMSYYIFTQNILKDVPIKLFNQGKLKRDFTYINDIVEGIYLITKQNKITKDFNIYNIGSGRTVEVIDLVKTLEKILDKKALIELQPMQEGDVFNTYADISKIKSDFGYEPKTDLQTGLTNFVEWFKSYHKQI